MALCNLDTALAGGSVGSTQPHLCSTDGDTEFQREQGLSRSLTCTASGAGTKAARLPGPLGARCSLRICTPPAF